jgi:hypothetical protein
VGKHISEESATAAKGGAEYHGKIGRSPTILIDSNAPNPYEGGTIAHRQWNEIEALHNARPNVCALRLRDQLPGGRYYARNRGLPYELLRAQHYAGTNELVEVEALVGGGQVDLVLTGNRRVDTKAWTTGMWAAASVGKRIGMTNQVANEVEQYLADSSYTLRFEFRYDIPHQVLTRLRELAADPRYAGRLTWAANIS